jgi:hypothetical protein
MPLHAGITLAANPKHSRAAQAAEKVRGVPCRVWAARSPPAALQSSAATDWNLTASSSGQMLLGALAAHCDAMQRGQCRRGCPAQAHKVWWRKRRRCHLPREAAGKPRTCSTSCSAWRKAAAVPSTARNTALLPARRARGGPVVVYAQGAAGALVERTGRSPLPCQQPKV